MSYPIIAEKEGIKIKPELMEKEKLYHCHFQDKIILVFKDMQEFLQCFEIEEKELVQKIKNSTSEREVEKIFEDYIKQENLNN